MNWQLKLTKQLTAKVLIAFCVTDSKILVNCFSTTRKILIVKLEEQVVSTKTVLRKLLYRPVGCFCLCS